MLVGKKKKSGTGKRMKLTQYPFFSHASGYGDLNLGTAQPCQRLATVIGVLRVRREEVNGKGDKDTE